MGNSGPTIAANTWDQRYRRGEHANDPPLDFIARLLPEGDGRRALDIACGAGRHAALMAARGWQVTAVDWSEAALEMVRMRDPRIHAIAADLEAGTFEIERNCWDLICVSFYLQRDLFASIRDGLKPGGLVAAAFPMVDERAGVGAMNPLYLLDIGELRALFDGFEILHDVETDPPAPKRRTAEILARKC